MTGTERTNYRARTARQGPITYYHADEDDEPPKLAINLERITVVADYRGRGKRILDWVLASLSLLFLSGVIAFSRWLFGGSLLLEVLAFVLFLMIVSSMHKHDAGKSAKMTRTEIKDWVDAGCPENIKEWKAQRGR
jgi:hypothetical protein